MMYENNILPKYGHLDPQKWRENRYWNEEIDNLFKSHFPIFDYLFKKYGSNHMKPGDMKPFMMADEFENIWMTAGLVCPELGVRDIAICFSTAMMTQTDEVNNDKHLKAFFVEFIEAFARCCDRISIAPILDLEVIIIVEIILLEW